MENNVVVNANYGWPFYVSNDKLDDNRVYFDPARWNELPVSSCASGGMATAS